MSRASDLLRILEAEDPSQEVTTKLADQIDAALVKAGMLKTVRSDETGNMNGKLYTLKNIDGRVYALFSVPVITQEKGSTDDFRASNNISSFRGVIDKIWDLRNKGYYIDQPRGQKGWEDKNSKTSGTIMQFHIAAPKQQTQQ